MQKSGTNLYDKELNNRNVKIISLLSKGGIKPLERRIKAMKKMKKIITSDKYDLIHFNICNSIDLTYALIAKKSGVRKIVVHSHNSNVSGKLKSLKILAHNIFKVLLKNVPTDYVACSNEAATWMFCKEKLKQVSIVNNSVDVERYLFNEEKRNNIRRKINADKDTFVIGNIARFSKEKNHLFLIDVFDEICKIEKNVKLLLVGDGELKSNIKEVVKNKGLEDKVIFYGVTQDVPGVLSAMDCFVLPSIFEGKPVVSIEEQISGLYGVYSNNITKEVSLTNLIEYIDLDKGKEYWATKILEKKKYITQRKSMNDVIEEKGYGLKKLKESIERIYNNNEQI